ncbi:unnamed protein product [Cylicocyclus nassatus]|uniref:Uncharacterized protein n=1 Tax=Cylicocyclus nassatus TaxID=53992 RepID=A0AA36GQS4_CYLNA|nr:unnamed protein product [Cylicocyclus nassatus]
MFTLSVDGRVVQGFQDGDMFNVTVKEDRVQTSVDAQGVPSIAVNNNRLGQIQLTYLMIFDERPGVEELYNAIDLFLGGKIARLSPEWEIQKQVDDDGGTGFQLLWELVLEKKWNMLPMKNSIIK